MERLTLHLMPEHVQRIPSTGRVAATLRRQVQQEYTPAARWDARSTNVLNEADVKIASVAPTGPDEIR